jgi:hypothetical protein
MDNNIRQEFKTRIQEYAKGDIDDIVGLYQISGWIERTLGIVDTMKLIELTLEFVKGALDQGFQAGEFHHGSTHFTVWDNQSADYVCSRIKEEWLSLGRKPNIADIVWFGLPDYKYTRMGIR